MSRRIGFVAWAGVLLLAACQDRAGTPTEVSAPSFSAAQGQGPLQNRYIVVFHPAVQNPDALTDQLVGAFGGTVHYRYRTAVKGFAATLGSPAVQGISRNPNVAWVEADGPVTTMTITQSNATWGLDRIDQRTLPLDTQYSYNADGSGVRVYIIDTGIRSTHNEFGGRVLPGFTAISDGNGTNDCNGHGTHVAGTAGGAVYGVAKNVQLVPVRVLNCSGSGTWSGVIAGVDWVTSQPYRPAVANMSLGGGANSSVDAAVTNSINAGVTYAIAAGNSNANACNYSPARVEPAITVGATTSWDARASYSNFGTCLDLFAPGSSITSAWHTSNTATNTISGTSMASPHVAGVAALVLTAGDQSPAAVRDAIVAEATPGVVTSAGPRSPNLLLYSLFAGAGAPPPPPPPPPPPETIVVHVGGLSGTATRSGNNWRATVTILIVDAGGNPVPGAAVSGSWSTGGSSSCTSGSSGQCSVTSSNLKRNTVASTTYTVTNVTGENMEYDSSANGATSITVQRP